MIIGHTKMFHLVIENHHSTEPVQGISIAQWDTGDIRVFWGIMAHWGQAAAAISENFRGLKEKVCD